MVILDGAIEIRSNGETHVMRPGDVACFNRGVEHELYSEGGMSFVEALAPVLRDHVPDAQRDLVLGAQRDSLHADS